MEDRLRTVDGEYGYAMLARQAKSMSNEAIRMGNEGEQH